MHRAAVISIAILFLSSIGIGFELAMQKGYSSGNLINSTDSRQLETLNSTAVDQATYELSSDIPYQSNAYRVGFVEPVFSYAAYQNNSFYNFFNQHTHDDVVVSRDIDFLVDNKLPSGPFFLYNHDRGDPPTIPWIKYFTSLKEHFGQIVPQARISILSDLDIHHGRVFNTVNGSNAYDILFLFHSEYVTQEEYNNLKQFVSNGGTAVFMDANTLYAEVEYDEGRDSITFVKGHRWEFDGIEARKGILERWLNETSNWMGSNFISTKPASEDIEFLNLPFGYNHSEEQHITNSNATILHDYGIYDPTDQDFNVTSALYEMKSGKGKIIGTSIYGHTLTNKAEFNEFLKFFDYIIVPYSLQTTYYTPVGNSQGSNEVPIYAVMNTGNVAAIQVNTQSQVVSLNLSRSQLQDDNLVIFIPRSLISPIRNTAFEGNNVSYSIMDDSGKKLSFDSISLDYGTGFRISLPSDVTNVQISYETPSFSFKAPKHIGLEAKGETNEINIGVPTIECISENNSKCIENLIIENDAPPSFPLGTTFVTWTALDPISNLSARSVQNITVHDNVSPNITIIDPPADSIIYSNTSKAIIEVNGSAHDIAGITKVEAYAYDLPLVGEDAPYKEATPVSSGNWSRWSITLVHPTNNTEVGIIARATDVGGNQDWAKGKLQLFQSKAIR